jgi:nickel/cobalt exporter
MDFSQLLQQGTAHAWLYVPVAILLGALHGLEPGHSKTMMAAFIIAIRGTAWQAALLGFCAALSHTLIIWVLAGLALKYGSHWNVEETEPVLPAHQRSHRRRHGRLDDHASAGRTRASSPSSRRPRP